MCHSQANESGFIPIIDRKSTRLNSSHQIISYAVFCLKKKKTSPVTRNQRAVSLNRSLIEHDEITRSRTRSATRPHTCSTSLLNCDKRINAVPREVFAR